MNTFEKLLNEKSEISLSNLNQVVDHARLLLASNEAEEISILRKVGLSAELDYVHEKKSDAAARQELQDQLGKTIVSLTDIQEICMKYRLFMRRANQYRGKIPVTLGSELKHFIQDKNITMGEHSDHNGFFIIAPPKMFNGYRPAGDIYRKTIADTVMNVSANAQQGYKNFLDTWRDPILVYQIPKTKYYGVVYSWGDDLSWVRRVLGFFTSEVPNRIISGLMAASIPLMVLTIMGFVPAAVKAITGVVIAREANAFLFFTWVILYVIVGLISCIYLFDKTAMGQAYRKFRNLIPTYKRWNG